MARQLKGYEPRGTDALVGQIPPDTDEQIKLLKSSGVDMEEVDPALLEVLQMQRAGLAEVAARKQAPITLADIEYPSIIFSEKSKKCKQKAMARARKQMNIPRGPRDGEQIQDIACTSSTPIPTKPLTQNNQKANKKLSAAHTIQAACNNTTPEQAKIAEHEETDDIARPRADIKLLVCEAHAKPAGQQQKKKPGSAKSPWQYKKEPQQQVKQQADRSQWCKPPPVPKAKKNKCHEWEVVKSDSSSSRGWTRAPPYEEICLTKPEINWSCREPLRMSVTEADILDWIGNVEDELQYVKREVCMREYRLYLHTPEDTRDMVDFDYEFWTRTIAPEYWVVERVGHQTTQMYWHEMKNSKLPSADEGDLEGVKPWWIDFPPYGAPLCQVYPQPEIYGIDPDETFHEQAARAADYGSQHAIKPYFKNKRKQERIERKKKEDGHDGVLW